MSAILAIDTSTSACSVALNQEGTIIDEFVVAPQDHTQRLLPMVENILVSSNQTLANLDAIAFSSGPGSFTGLRICLGVVQGLAYGANLPVVGVSTLEVMAATAMRTLELPVNNSEKTIIIPALDARMSEIYWGIFQSSQNVLSRIEPDKVTSPTDLNLSEDQLEDIQHGTHYLIGVGDGWTTHPACEGVMNKIETELFPHAYDLSILAQDYLANGKAVSAFEAQPTYIRNEVSWVKRQKIRS